jgi:hypothetical protein
MTPVTFQVQLNPLKACKTRNRMSVMTDSHSSASGSIKKMIRDTNRLLSRPNLPADLRREQERKLSALQVTLSDRQKVEIEREMAVKYRMVKFFERKKALRRLAAAQAKTDSSAVSEAQLDLAYILHFPKDRKYIALYQTSSSAETLAEREAIRKQISEKLALLGAETMLAKVTQSKKALKASDDDDEDEDEDSDEDQDDSDDSDDSDDESDEDGSDSGNSDDDDEGDSEDDDDELSYDESEEDSDNSELSDDEDDDLDSDEDDMDSEDDKSGDNDDEEEDSNDSEDKEDSDDESDDSEEEDSEEEEEDSEDDEDSDTPKPKKVRH